MLCLKLTDNSGPAIYLAWANHNSKRQLIMFLIMSCLKNNIHSTDDPIWRAPLSLNRQACFQASLFKKVGISEGIQLLISLFCTYFPWNIYSLNTVNSGPHSNSKDLSKKLSTVTILNNYFTLLLVFHKKRRSLNSTMEKKKSKLFFFLHHKQTGKQRQGHFFYTLC